MSTPAQGIEASDFECPICFLLMTPPGRNPMVLNCGHILCEQCLDQLRSRKCPLCNKEITTQAHCYALTTLLEKFLATHEIDPEVNPPSAPREVPLECTVSQHGRTYIEQKWYHCKTCGLVGSLGCCEACAKICHKGHDCSFDRVASRCYCDCGAGDGPHPCQCMRASREPSLRRCTFEGFGNTYIGQRFYNCATCGLTGRLGCCEACAQICHAGHNVTLVPDSDPPSVLFQSYCDCGSGGRCRCCDQRTYQQCSRGISPLLVSCESCGVQVCPYCAQHCHSGHPLVIEPGMASGPCQCRCQAQPQSPVLSGPPPWRRPRRFML